MTTAIKLRAFNTDDYQTFSGATDSDNEPLIGEARFNDNVGMDDSDALVTVTDEGLSVWVECDEYRLQRRVGMTFNLLVFIAEALPEVMCDAQLRSLGFRRYHHV